MLVVKVEVWPAGDEAGAFEIGRMEVVNESSLSAVSDYSAHIVQQETPRLQVVSTAEQKSAIRRRKTRPRCYMPGGVA